MSFLETLKDKARQSFNAISHVQQKYELTGETLTCKEFGWWGKDRTLTRIRALIDIPTHGVKAGDLGGYIESVNCLSDRGDCWVGGKAKVFRDARVRDNALVTDSATLKQTAKALENTTVKDYAELSQHSIAAGSSQIGGFAKMSWHSRADGNAVLKDQAELRMNTHIGGDTVLTTDAPLSAADQADMDNRYRNDPIYRKIERGSVGQAPRL